MKNKFKDKIIHVIGINGTGMSAIARILINLGFIVQGSDKKRNSQTNNLKRYGIKIFKSHNNININKVKLIIVSSIIKYNNKEIILAKYLGIKIISRTRFLSLLIKNTFNICITGSHGKSSISSLTYNLLQCQKPSLICGANIKKLRSNAKMGNKKLFIIESDESDGTFIKLSFNIYITTNIDCEHFDYFDNFRRIIIAYNISYKNSSGYVIYCLDNIYLEKISSQYANKYNCINYGFNQLSDLKIINLYTIKHNSTFNVKISKIFRKIININIKKINNIVVTNSPKHKITNYLVTIAVGLVRFVPILNIKKRIFNEIKIYKRFCILNKSRSTTIIEDYAHHPKELKATLNKLRINLIKREKIIIIFEPHKFSRLKLLLKSFIRILSVINFLVITPTYSSEEAVTKKAKVNYLISSIYNYNKKSNIEYGINDMIIFRYILNEVKNNNIINLLGAGKITFITKKINKSIKYYFQNFYKKIREKNINRKPFF